MTHPAPALADARALLGPELQLPEELIKIYGVQKFPPEMQSLFTTFILFPDLDLDQRAQALGKSVLWVRLVVSTDMFAAKLDAIRKAQAALDQYTQDKLHAEAMQKLYTELNDQLDAAEGSMPALPILIGYLERLLKKAPGGGTTIAIQNNNANTPAKEGAVPASVVANARAQIRG